MSGRSHDSDDTPDFSFLNGDSPAEETELQFPDAEAVPDRAVPPIDNSTDDPVPVGQPSQDPDAASAPPEPVASKEALSDSQTPTGPTAGSTAPDSGISQKTFSLLAGYAAALTLLLILLAITGRLQLSGTHPLESLPDVAPLKSNEFREVPPDTDLPEDHTLQLGESRQYGDVVLTPVRVTREPIRFYNILMNREVEDMTSPPVLKLWFRLENASSDVAFPPWDTALMTHRYPAEGTDDNTLANSWLHVSGDGKGQRVLNYFHPPDSSMDMVGQHSRELVEPGDSLTTFIAASEDLSDLDESSSTRLRWRLQIRKGVNRPSGNGVTTLVDVVFDASDITDPSPEQAADGQPS